MLCTFLETFTARIISVDISTYIEISPHTFKLYPAFKYLAILEYYLICFLPYKMKFSTHTHSICQVAFIKYSTFDINIKFNDCHLFCNIKSIPVLFTLIISTLKPCLTWSLRFFWDILILDIRRILFVTLNISLIQLPSKFSYEMFFLRCRFLISANFSY